MPRKASEQPPRAAKRAKPEAPTKVVGGFRLPPSAVVTPSPVPKELVIDVATVRCPACGGEVWDNRENKRNPRAPDFKCKRRVCDGVIWPRANVRYVEAQPELAPVASGHDERPLVWRDDSIREAIDTSKPGTYWSYLLSTDGTVAYALATTVDRQKNQHIAHWGVAWTHPHSAFSQVHHGEAEGRYCRFCQRNDCVGAKAAQRTLTHGPVLL